MGNGKTCVLLFYSMVYLGHISYYSMARYVIIKRIYIYIYSMVFYDVLCRMMYSSARKIQKWKV